MDINYPFLGISLRLFFNFLLNLFYPLHQKQNSTSRYQIREAWFVRIKQHWLWTLTLWSRCWPWPCAALWGATYRLVPTPRPPHRTPGGVLAESRCLAPYVLSCAGLCDLTDCSHPPPPQLSSSGFSRQEYWSGLHFLLPWLLLWQLGSLPLVPPGKPSETSLKPPPSFLVPHPHTWMDPGATTPRGRAPRLTTQRTEGNRPSHRGQKPCLGKTRKPKQRLLRMTEKGTALVTQRGCY